MIVTRNWLQEFLDISKISTESISNTLNSIGLEVDSISNIRIPNDVVVGKVTSCKKHPNADKLNVCMVDVGKEEELQIVCGASNVQEGQFVPVAVVGAVLGDNFKIKKAKLRGVESFGMICSSTEIGLPKLNDGILELDDSIGELVLGQELNEYEILNDDIIDIELTANRGDCLSIFGVARELGTYYKIPLNNFDENTTDDLLSIGQIMEVNYDSLADASIAYRAINIKEFKPKLLYDFKAGIIGQYSENKILNILNYASHSTGVVFNYYPDSKLQKKADLSVINIKKDDLGFDISTSGEIVNRLNISSVMLEVKNEDKVIVESIYIDPNILSQKVHETKIKTDEVYYKTSRGSNPDVIYGVGYVSNIFSDCGCSIFKGSESFIDEKEKKEIVVSLNKINSIIGQEIEKAKVEAILNSLGFNVKDVGNNTLSLKIPLFRHDIENIADVTEEVVRMIGIDNIVAKPLSMSESVKISNITKSIDLRNKLRIKAISNGFFETLTYLFSSREKLSKYKFDVIKEDKDILNPITNELNTLRTTLDLNLIEAVSSNFKNGFKSVRLFEIGTIYNSDREEEVVATFVFSGEKESPAPSNNAKPQPLSLFEFANKISNIIGDFELQNVDTVPNSFIHPYQVAKIVLNNQPIGLIYKLHPKAQEDFDIDTTFIAEIKFDKLSDEVIKADPISKYQHSKRDISIIAPKELEYDKIRQTIKELDIPQIVQFNLIDVYSDESLADKESLTIRFVLQSDNQTLTEEMINNIMDSILEALKTKLDIGIR